MTKMAVTPVDPLYPKTLS